MLYSHEGLFRANSLIGRISDVELRYMGQAFQLGRYTIHYHMSGTLDQSFVRRCSIHHTYNRAVAIHAVHGLRVQDNVAYDNMGHAFFLEDGVETGNVITGNLGVLTRRSFAMLNTDQTPATFWITNADNVVTGNVAAGSQNYGFWFDVPPAPRGASANCALGDTICPTRESFCPQGATIRRFEDNGARESPQPPRHLARRVRTHTPPPACALAVHCSRPLQPQVWPARVPHGRWLLAARLALRVAERRESMESGGGATVCGLAERVRARRGSNPSARPPHTRRARCHAHASGPMVTFVRRRV